MDANRDAVSEAVSDAVSDAVAALRQAVGQNEDLQRRLRVVTTAEELSALAREAGCDLSPAELVKHYAGRLLEADDAKTVRNFNLCGWDAGELLWLLKHWED